MPIEQKDIETFLKVGCPVVFYPNLNWQSSPKYTTWIRGWRKPTYILLDKPKISGRNAAIRENETCMIQYVNTGRVCMFESTVFDWDTRSHNACCRIGWPDTVRTNSFRRNERVPIITSCRLFLDEAMIEGRVLNVSMGGCQCSAAEPLPVDTTGEVSFALPDGCVVDRAKIIVRNVHQGESGGYDMGLSFADGQVFVQGGVGFFVMSVLERADGLRDNPHRVIVIDQNPETGGLLRDLLEKRGYDPFVAEGPVDGFYRLHGGGMKALLINQSTTPFNGVDLCRMVKSSADFVELPVYVYGGQGADWASQAKDAGAAAHLPEGTALADIVAALAEGDEAPPAARPEGQDDAKENEDMSSQATSALRDAHGDAVARS